MVVALPSVKPRHVRSMVHLRHYVDGRRMLRYDAQSGAFDEVRAEALHEGSPMMGFGLTLQR